MALCPKPDQAAIAALKALAWLANQPAGLDPFLTASGAEPSSLRARADEPEFLCSVLDFLLANERLLTEFCGETSIPAPAVHAARRVLAQG
jgi:hypothetical protein